MKIYLVRHPEPTDAGQRCYGREDVSVGREARTSAETSIRAQIAAPVMESAAIFSSPLSRCRLLAERLASPRPPQIADDLTEIDFGLWEGKAWDAVPRNELDAWAADVWGYRPGGGESAHGVAERWRHFSARVRARGDSTVVAVTHAGFIRVALACEGRLNAEEFAAKPIAFGSVHCLELNETQVRACVR